MTNSSRANSSTTRPLVTNSNRSRCSTMRPMVHTIGTTGSMKTPPPSLLGQYNAVMIGTDRKIVVDDVFFSQIMVY